MVLSFIETIYRFQTIYREDNNIAFVLYFTIQAESRYTFTAIEYNDDYYAVYSISLLLASNQQELAVPGQISCNANELLPSNYLIQDPAIMTAL